MLARKKEEQTKRRKRKDIDIINDNDDLIDHLLGEMRNAAEVLYFKVLICVPIFQEMNLLVHFAYIFLVFVFRMIAT